MPVSKIITETTSFDIQKIKDPNINGTSYQQGPNYSFENRRQYVLTRDGHKCQHCGSKEHLEVHHIKFKSQGGNDDIENLVTLCHNCHSDLHDEKFKIAKSKTKSFKAAAGVQTMKNSLMRILTNICLDVEETHGYITKCDRITYNILKTHSNDAFAIAKNFNAEHLGYHYKTVQKKRHERSLHIHNFRKGGIRRSNIAPKWINGSGFKRGDFVLFNGLKGFISGSTNGYAVLKDINGNKISKNAVSTKKLKLLRRQEGQFLVNIV